MSRSPRPTAARAVQLQPFVDWDALGFVFSITKPSEQKPVAFLSMTDATAALTRQGLGLLGARIAPAMSSPGVPLLGRCLPWRLQAWPRRGDRRSCMPCSASCSQPRCHGGGKEDTLVMPRARFPSPVCCLHLPGCSSGVSGSGRSRPSSREPGTQSPSAPLQPPPREGPGTDRELPAPRPLPAPGPRPMPASLPSPAGRLQKRLRAARRCWRVSGLQSLLWPFRHRFSLEAAPDRSRPLRAMLEPAPRAAVPHPLPLPAPAAILSEGALPSGLAACRRGG